MHAHEHDGDDEARRRRLRQPADLPADPARVARDLQHPQRDRRLRGRGRRGRRRRRRRGARRTWTWPASWPPPTWPRARPSSRSAPPATSSTAPTASGPHLNGVVGRPVGSVGGFSYSDAMAAHGGDWTAEELFAFLANPKKDVPGTKMSFAGPAQAARTAPTSSPTSSRCSSSWPGRITKRSAACNTGRKPLYAGAAMPYLAAPTDATAA